MKSKNINLQLFVLILLLEVFLSQMIYNTSEYTLGPNFIKNYNFTDIPLPSPTTTSVVYNYSMSSWTCNRVCKLVSPYNMCIQKSITCNTTSSILGLDLDSSSYSVVSQSINITTAGQYIVYVEWYPPLVNSTGKTFSLYFGTTPVITVTTNTTVIKSYSTQNIVMLSAGKYLINMKMYGTKMNNYGIILHTINVQQMIPINSQNITGMQNYINILPDSEINIDYNF